MANYYGSARSNFFRVENPSFFEFCMDQLNVVYEKNEDSQGESQYFVCGDENGFPSCIDKEFIGVVRVSSDAFNGIIFIDLDKKDGNHQGFSEKSIHAFIPDAEVNFIEMVSCIKYDICDEVYPHLQGDSVAVFQESGAEKLRYLTGTSIAVNRSGAKKYISINDIYSVAASSFGIHESRIARCEYKNMVISEDSLAKT